MEWKSSGASRHLLSFVLLTTVFLQSCAQKSSAQPEAGNAGSWKQALKDSTVGDWQEIHTLNEMLHFDADGSLIMSSPAEHRSCTYDFPDSNHIRLDCMYPQGTRYAQTWGFSVTDDKLTIRDEHSVGTYRRK
jgi:hypothetical protein